MTSITDLQITADLADGFEDNFDPTVYEAAAETLNLAPLAEVVSNAIAAVGEIPAGQRTQSQRVEAFLLGCGDTPGLTVLSIPSRRAADRAAQARHDAYLRDELAEIAWDGDQPVDDYFAFGKRVPFEEATVDTAPWIEVGA